MHFVRKKHKTKMSLNVIIRLLLLLLITFPSLQALAQQKSKKKITIEHADDFSNDEAVVVGAQRLIGNVVLIHKNIIMKCDSAWKYTNLNVVDAFGHVHIISNDTINLWADFINYNGDNEIAKARKNVILTDPELTLTTDSLDFDLDNEIGYYNYGGRIVDSANVLTSMVGRYYTKQNELFFTDSVKLVNEEYVIDTDTMKYNTNTEIVDFEGKTTIIGDSTYVYSTNGWFNTKTNESELQENSTIRRGDTQLQADYIFYNDNSGDGHANGNVIINDYANKMIVLGNKAEYNDFNQYALVTDSAMWIQYYENDSLFLHADTLYTMPDTAAEGQKLLITYRHARFYRTDIQGACDSLIYYTRDSTIQLYNDPVLWSLENQMTADFIEFINNAEPPNEVYLNNNSFIIQEMDSAKYNQIKGKNMVGLINGQSLYRIDVNGNGQSIYYPADEKGYIGVNKAESSNIILYLSENQIKRITFVGSPVGVMNPLLKVVPEDTRLPGFNWRNNERPINRFDVFSNNDRSKNPTSLPKTEIINELPSINEVKNTLEEKMKEQPVSNDFLLEN